MAVSRSLAMRVGACCGSAAAVGATDAEDATGLVAATPA